MVHGRTEEQNKCRLRPGNRPTGEQGVPGTGASVVFADLFGKHEKILGHRGQRGNGLPLGHCLVRLIR